MWLGTTDLGLYYWQDGEFHQFPDEKLKKETIFALAVDTLGQLWVGTQLGLHCYERDGRQKQMVPFTTEIRALLLDRQGVLWAGTSGNGLAQFHGNEISYLRQTNGLVNDFVTTGSNAKVVGAALGSPSADTKTSALAIYMSAEASRVTLKCGK